MPDRPVPIRFRKNVPTAWLRLTLREGRNRQVRRMTASVGFPTLRLVRIAIGPIELGDLAPGQLARADGPGVQSLEGVAIQKSWRLTVSPLDQDPMIAVEDRSV